MQRIWTLLASAAAAAIATTALAQDVPAVQGASEAEKDSRWRLAPWPKPQLACQWKTTQVVWAAVSSPVHADAVAVLPRRWA